MTKDQTGTSSNVPLQNQNVRPDSQKGLVTPSHRPV
jgi:hypothetical protein